MFFCQFIFGKVGGASSQGSKFNRHLLAQLLQPKRIQEQSSRHSDCREHVVWLFYSTEVDLSTGEVA